MKVLKSKRNGANSFTAIISRAAAVIRYSVDVVHSGLFPENTAAIKLT